MTNFSQLVQLAKSGDKQAQQRLAQAYAQGKEVEQNDFLAQHWAAKAQGKHIPLPLPQDASDQLKELYSLAMQGDHDAQIDIASAYREGDGVEQNDSEAFCWCQKAASGQEPAYKAYLASTYHFGRGTAIDMDKAIALYEQAAAGGYADAMFDLGSIYHIGQNGVKVNKRRAIKWYKMAADLGEYRSACNLGRMYFCGEGTKIDFAKSREYFHRAIEYGDTSPAAIRGVQMIDDFYNKHPYLFDREIK